MCVSGVAGARLATGCNALGKERVHVRPCRHAGLQVWNARHRRKVGTTPAVQPRSTPGDARTLGPQGGAGARSKGPHPGGARPRQRWWQWRSLSSRQNSASRRSLAQARVAPLPPPTSTTEAPGLAAARRLASANAARQSSIMRPSCDPQPSPSFNTSDTTRASYHGHFPEQGGAGEGLVCGCAIGVARVGGGACGADRAELHRGPQAHSTTHAAPRSTQPTTSSAPWPARPARLVATGAHQPINDQRGGRARIHAVLC